MRLEGKQDCDVLVLGCGIAGISAAIAAAEEGCSVTLLCEGPVFSGSSFYPGTWGLGLIGPAGEEDEKDLERTICQVGCGMADPVLVRRLVHGIAPAISRVRAMGVKLKRADQGAEREFIPCFDHKHRDWNGILSQSAKEVFSERLTKLGVNVIARMQAMELVKQGDRVCGVVAFDGKNFCYYRAKAVVLATGGYGSLFKYHLCTNDVSATGQALALAAGCQLVNMEFMQMMPGYLDKAFQTVFNEKAFRFTRMRTPEGEMLHWEDEDRLLDVRSGHGPFTSRLDSAQIDRKLFEIFRADERGVTVTYTEEMQQRPPEFIRTYFDWLKEAKGLTMADEVSVGIFAHAANGGVRIDENGKTNVEGLYAAGEVTGGMHGADRIGGLSTANGLVFGEIAGRAAAGAAKTQKDQAPASCEFEMAAAEGCEKADGELQKLMYQNLMVLRNREGIERVMGWIEETRQNMILSPSDDRTAVARTRRLQARLLTAQSVAAAALFRKESRGSHFREDYPQERPEYGVSSVVSFASGGITVCEKEKQPWK